MLVGALTVHWKENVKAKRDAVDALKDEIGIKLLSQMKPKDFPKAVPPSRPSTPWAPSLDPHAKLFWLIGIATLGNTIMIVFIVASLIQRLP